MTSQLEPNRPTDKFRLNKGLSISLYWVYIMKTALLLYWILCSQILPSEPIFLIQGVVLSKHNDIQTDFSSKYHDKPQTAPKYDILPQGKLAPSLKDIKPTTPRATLAERTKIAETSMIARMRKERIEEVQRSNANKPQY